jgi:Arc/MetJ family transcription regulator
VALQMKRRSQFVTVIPLIPLRQHRMQSAVASRIMRTTIDIDDPILKEVKRLQRREGKSLGRLVSDLLAQSLAASKAAVPADAPAFRWVAKPMRARLDLGDKHALLDAMDERGE